MYVKAFCKLSAVQMHNIDLNISHYTFYLITNSHLACFNLTPLALSI